MTKKKTKAKELKTKNDQLLGDSSVALYEVIKIQNHKRKNCSTSLTTVNVVIERSYVIFNEFLENLKKFENFTEIKSLQRKKLEKIDYECKNED
ncbi:MAG: hypothetical protein ACE5Q9_05120 [Nitrosopumilus sp.]|nr:hypothetical protein [Nitrosopumilaceae archaeon]